MQISCTVEAGSSNDYVSFLELFMFPGVHNYLVIYSRTVSYESIQMFDWTCKTPFIVIYQIRKYTQ